MKVRDIIEALARTDPELTVCQFTESGPEEISDVGVFKGEYFTGMAPKLVWGRAHGEYIGLGSAGDFEITALVSDCERMQDLLDTDNEPL